MNNKVTILCAMENGYEADIFMRAVERSLQAERVAVVRVNMVHKVIETRHTRTAFMWDIRQQPLDGVRADALFGKEPFKQAYKHRLASDAPYDTGMGLFEYICAVENKYNMIDAIDRAKRIMINSCYGKMGEWKYEALPNGGFEMVYKPESLIKEPKILTNAVSAITIHGLSGDYTYKLDKGDMEIKKMDIDEWSKMPPYLTQQQIYITTARGGGKNWYSEQWRKFMEQLDKEPVIKPLSRKDESMAKLPEIKNVIFNDPATIVMWADGTKTVVQCQDGDIYDPEKGLAMAISKKIMGNKRDYYHTFKHWLKKYKKPEEEIREEQIGMYIPRNPLHDVMFAKEGSE